MSKQVTIDLDVAGHINLSGITLNEERVLKFTATDGHWEGTDYSFKVYNSEAKNTFVDLTDDLAVNGADMLLTFEPARQQISTGESFYEVFNETKKTIEFKGTLNVKK